MLFLVLSIRFLKGGRMLKEKAIKEMLWLIAGMVLVTVPLSFASVGANYAEEIIINANTFQTIERQTAYLIHEGERFMETEQYLDAQKVAGYILANLDKTSQEAQQLLEKASQRIQEDR
jgi:hypothetical protein